MTPLAEALFIVTDVETTGLSAARNRITEVACLHVQAGGIVAEHRTLVNPEQHIPANIQSMTGITNAMVFAADRGDVVYPRVREWFPKNGVIVGHNVAFDVDFLQAEFLRHSVPALTNPRLCTARLARRLLPAQRGWSLHKLAAWFGIKIRGRHRAGGDAEATARVLVELLDMLHQGYDCETVEDVVSVQYRKIDAFRQTDPRMSGLQQFAVALPDTPGVYRMLDYRQQILYIGKAVSLRERVSTYFRNSALHTSKIAEMVGRVRSITFEETGSELGALLLESRLIKEHQPKYNTLQKRYRRYAFLRIDTSDPFARPEWALEIEPDGAEYYGPFASRTAVEAIIDTINHSFGLRECEGRLSPDPSIVPCIYHQIGRCGAPCAGLQSPAEYADDLDRVRAFLNGGETGIVGSLEDRMFDCAERMDFEEAAAIRNRVDELKRVFSQQERLAGSINTNNVVIVLPAAGGTSRAVFFIRFGRLARQIVVASRTPSITIRRLIEDIYYSGETAPDYCGKEEIDGIRIIAGYLHQRRHEGTRIYVDEAADAEAITAAVLAALRGLAVHLRNSGAQVGGTSRSTVEYTPPPMPLHREAQVSVSENPPRSGSDRTSL